MIHLIRHARPSITGLILGRTDLPPAVPVAPSALAVQMVYSSPLDRALKTAEQMFPGRAIVVAQGLAERDMGDWEGLQWTEIQLRWPAQAAAAVDDWFAFTPPGAERWICFADRVRQAWNAIPSRGDIAIIAHAGVNAILSNLIAGSGLAEFRQHYEEVITLEIPDKYPATEEPTTARGGDPAMELADEAARQPRPT